MASATRLRWVVLHLTCIIMIGNYYCFDNPAALKSHLQTRFHTIAPKRFEFLFNLLYSVYSIPNIFLPFLGGYLVDRVGVRIMLLVFCTIIVIGQLLVAIGCSYRDFSLMLAGRVFFGFGGESLGVAQSTLLASWFKSNELAFALGINLSIARLGSVLNNKASPYVAEKSSVDAAFYFGFIICCISLLATFILIPIDKKVENKRIKSGQKQTSEPIRLQDVRQFSWLFWLLSLSCLVTYGCVLPFNNIASSLLMERDYFKSPSVECVRCGTGEYIGQDVCNQLAEYCPSVPPYAWPLPKLSANCTITLPEDQMNCSTSPPWIEPTSIDCENQAWKFGVKTVEYCKSKWKAVSAASTPMSVPYIISAFLSPILGILVDKFGYRASLAMIASLFLMTVHMLLAWSSVNVYLPLIMQGVAYSVYAASLWPSVPYVVREHQVGTAYGVITAIQNMGLSSFPLAVAGVYNVSKEKYIPNVEVFFVTCAFLGTLVGILLNIVDYRNGSVLNRGNKTLELDSTKENLLSDLVEE